MVIGYHVIVTAYGFWLPNDPRGSWSEFVRRWELLQFGSATKTEERRSIAGRAVDREARQVREQAEAALLYPAVQFDSSQIKAIADGVADGVKRSGFLIHAAAVLHDHTHLVIGRHHYPIEQIINRLKGAATRELAAQAGAPVKSASHTSGWSAVAVGAGPVESIS